MKTIDLRRAPTRPARRVSSGRPGRRRASAIPASSRCTTAASRATRHTSSWSLLGPSLADRIANGPVPVEEVIEVGQQVASALDAAHARGLVHRDIKPANIAYAGDGRVRVLDFGITQLGETPGSQALATHTVMGTAEYLARAGHGRTGGRSRRPLRAGVRALRPARRPPPVPGADTGRHDADARAGPGARRPRVAAGDPGLAGRPGPRAATRRTGLPVPRRSRRRWPRGSRSGEWRPQRCRRPVRPRPRSGWTRHPRRRHAGRPSGGPGPAGRASRPLGTDVAAGARSAGGSGAARLAGVRCGDDPGPTASDSPTPTASSPAAETSEPPPTTASPTPTPTPSTTEPSPTPTANPADAVAASLSTFSDEVDSSVTGVIDNDTAKTLDDRVRDIQQALRDDEVGRSSSRGTSSRGVRKAVGRRGHLDGCGAAARSSPRPMSPTPSTPTQAEQMRNWAGNVEFSAARLVAPTSVAVAGGRRGERARPGGRDGSFLLAGRRHVGHAGHPRAGPSSRGPW